MKKFKKKSHSNIYIQRKLSNNDNYIKKLDYKLKFIINYIIVCKRKWWILDIKHLKNIFNITKFSYL